MFTIIFIIDYGIGNLGSIYNMLNKIGVKSQIASSVGEIQKADKLILPGVGSFDSGMENLKRLGFTEALEKEVIFNKKPLLGICLGMQLLGKRSEEGKLQGLGWIDFECKKFKFTDNRLKVPHMGWNKVEIVEEDGITLNMADNMRFYFVHSYYAECANSKNILMQAEYGAKFTCAVKKDNILGVQFHPEKSHKYGMLLLKNFVENY